MATSSSPSAAPSAGSHHSGSRPRMGGGGRPGARGESGDGRPRRWGPPRRKVCRFCVDRVLDIDYKNATILRNFITERGKMISGRSTGNCAKHHRMLTRAIKRARNLALIPFAVV